jgi:hypothetical protein
MLDPPPPNKKEPDMVTMAQVVVLSVSALVSTVLSALIVGLRHRRRVAAERQAEQEAAYDAAVAGFRASVEAGLRRRAQLVELLEVAFAGRTDRALTSAGSPDVDAAVSRLYLDLALAGEDHGRREAVLRMVRRGISDIEMLIPEVPLPPAPQARLRRAAHRRAVEWQAARTSELGALRGLLVTAPAEPADVAHPVTVPAPAVVTMPVPAQHGVAGLSVGTDLAIAS